MKRISVIGTGYVGLVSAACFAEIGHECICVDVDASKVDKINRGQPTIHEEGLEDILRRQVGRRLRATTDLRAAVLSSDITFIAVGTPFDGERIDLTYIRAAASQVGAALREKSTYHVVVVKSTVVPGTTDDVVLPNLERASGKRAGIDFGVGMNPEFLTEGTAVADFREPDRIVLGGIDQASIDAQRDVYATFTSVPIVATNNKTAEMIKYASNAVLANLISFSNEIANVCSGLGGIDVTEVMKGVHLSRYFTTRLPDGRSIEAPINSFLWAGCGYGGSCLPKDTQALSAHAAAHGVPMPLLDSVIRTNAGQPAKIVELLKANFASLSGLRVAVLGLAFKQDTDDVRESPAIPIARMLVREGVHLKAYDPIALETARAVLPDPEIEFVGTLGEAIKDIDAAIVVTRWDEFRQLPDLISKLPSAPLLIDGRRMLDKRKLVRYAGIGLRNGAARAG